jgi:FMN phosphatase YigB (HAD superfamily)
MSSKKKILWDIDDVLVASAPGFVKYSNERWGHNLVADDYHEAWDLVWGVSLEEAIRRADELHISGVVGTYAHFPEAVAVLQNLAAKYEHLAGTSRRITLRPETEALIHQGPFKDLFSAIHYLGIWDTDKPVKEQLKLTKAELCKALRADYLVDDQLKHCIGAAEAGVPALLFGNYRWNQTDKPLPNGITRVADWRAVQEFFDAQS